MQKTLLKWLATIGVGVVIAVIPPPAGVEYKSWLLLALLFIRGLGRSTFGLSYALIGTDFVLASVGPSNGARNGGIVIPITVAVSESYDSRPENGTASRLGEYLTYLLYQTECVIAATFLTGHAGNF